MRRRRRRRRRGGGGTSAKQKESNADIFRGDEDIAEDEDIV
jgi:hypothetical protein